MSDMNSISFTLGEYMGEMFAIKIYLLHTELF